MGIIFLESLVSLVNEDNELRGVMVENDNVVASISKTKIKKVYEF